MKLKGNTGQRRVADSAKYCISKLFLSTFAFAEYEMKDFFSTILFWPIKIKNKKTSQVLKAGTQYAIKKKSIVNWLFR